MLESRDLVGVASRLASELGHHRRDYKSVRHASVKTATVRMAVSLVPSPPNADNAAVNHPNDSPDLTLIVSGPQAFFFCGKMLLVSHSKSSISTTPNLTRELYTCITVASMLDRQRASSIW